MLLRSAFNVTSCFTIGWVFCNNGRRIAKWQSLGLEYCGLLIAEFMGVGRDLGRCQKLCSIIN